jgi:hypothetical protein
VVSRLQNGEITARDPIGERSSLTISISGKRPRRASLAVIAIYLVTGGAGRDDAGPAGEVFGLS